MLPARLHLHRSVLIQLPLLLFAVSLHGQEQDTGKPIRAG